MVQPDPGPKKHNLGSTTMSPAITPYDPVCRVKLVEKALPANEADQIRSQDNLKRSLQISAGLYGVYRYAIFSI